MNFEVYIEKVREKIKLMTLERIGVFDVNTAYETKFELKWFATKLKMFSFVSFVDQIDEDTFKKYTQECFEYSRKNYKGLPRGIQNGFVSFSVLASENVDVSAITFVNGRPKKHFSAFEMPIIVDLKNEKLLFYNQTPLWGKIYYEFFREYIKENYNFM